MALRLWIGLACFVPLAVVASDPVALLRMLARYVPARREAGRQRATKTDPGSPHDPAQAERERGVIPALAWLPALLVAIIGTGLIGMVLIP